MQRQQGRGREGNTWKRRLEITAWVGLEGTLGSPLSHLLLAVAMAPLGSSGEETEAQSPISQE